MDFSQWILDETCPCPLFDYISLPPSSLSLSFYITLPSPPLLLSIFLLPFLSPLRHYPTAMDSPPSRRPCFSEEDDGLASLADMEAGFSGSHTQNHHAFFSRSLCLSYSFTRRASFRNLPVSSPRSVKFYDARFEEHRPHFLEACSRCKKPLGGNSDIFMYRGDTPFCSEECRQEQIEIDEAKEKKLSLSSMKAMIKKDQRKSSSPSKSSARGYNFITSTVAAA